MCNAKPSTDLNDAKLKWHFMSSALPVIAGDTVRLLGTGEWRSDMTAEIPTNDAPPELHKGVEVQLSNGLQAIVTDVTPDHVVIDANHSLAGKDLNFEVELVKLQKVCCLCRNATRQHALHLATSACIASRNISLH